MRSQTPSGVTARGSRARTQYRQHVPRPKVFAGTNNLLEVIGGTGPMTVQQYTAANAGLV
jgi:hypothetical protein